MLREDNSDDTKFKTEGWKQGIPGLLNVVKTCCKKPLSCADVTYFYSSTLGCNLSLHLANGNGPYFEFANKDCLRYIPVAFQSKPGHCFRLF